MKGEGDTDRLNTTITQSPSQAVVEAVATLEGVPERELRQPEYEPIHSVIDPEALDALFANRADGLPRPTGTVSFTYCEYDVTVDWGGMVTVEQSDGD